jgi:hypothetical protein
MNTREIMRRKRDEAQKALDVWEFLAGGLGLNPPAFSFAFPKIGEPSHIVWYEMSDSPWERMAQILKPFKPLVQTTTTHWGRQFSIKGHRATGVPADKWEDIGTMLVHANEGVADLIAWTYVTDTLVKIVLRSPLEQMGVRARVLIGNYVEYSMREGAWEKILEPDSGAWFYHPAILVPGEICGAPVMVSANGKGAAK